MPLGTEPGATFHVRVPRPSAHLSSAAAVAHSSHFLKPLDAREGESALDVALRWRSSRAATPPIEPPPGVDGRRLDAVAALIEVAARPWSPESHALYPPHLRKQACETVGPLHQIGSLPQLAGGPPPSWFAQQVLSHLIKRPAPAAFEKETEAQVTGLLRARHLRTEAV